MAANDEMKKMRKEITMDFFKSLSQHLMEKNQKDEKPQYSPSEGPGIKHRTFGIRSSIAT
jgi:hypothetical protein